MPLLLLRNGAEASATATRTPVAATHQVGPGPAGATVVRVHPTAATAGPVVIASAPVRNVVATTTTTAPRPTAPTTTTAPRAPGTTTTTTTTTSTTTTTAPAAPVAGSRVRTVGIVTYYDHPAGRCASPWLPFGTVVQVTNPANGSTVTCVVDDREADTARSIDLATGTFAQIAPLGQGVVDAHLSW